MHNTDTDESRLLEMLESTLDSDIDFTFKPDNVCMICSNKSIVAGELISDYANMNCDIPTTVTDDERIPGWLDEKSLIIFMINEDKKDQLYKLIEKFSMTKCGIVTLTDFDVDMNDVLLNIRIRSEDHFEYLGEILGHLFVLFDKMKILSKTDVLGIIPELKEKHNKALKAFSKVDMNELSKKNIMIAYPVNMRSTAMLWKFIFYSRLKRPTFTTEYPEFNHNEIVGWCMSPQQSKDYVMLFIVDANSSELLRVISDSMINVLTNGEVNVTKIKIDGHDIIEKNLLGFIIGEATPRNGGKQ